MNSESNGAARELEQLRELFHEAPGAMALLSGPTHIYEMANPAYLRLVAGRDIIGKTVGEALPEVVSQGFIDLLNKVYATGVPYVGSAVSVMLEGGPSGEKEERILDFVYQPRRSAKGTITGIFVQVTDVTERKRAEDALIEQRRLYEAILTNTPDLAYVFDLQHRFIYANEGLLKMWGRTWDEAIGKNCLQLGYEPWHAALHDREIEQVVATKKPIRGEVPFTGTFGRRIYDYLFVPVFGTSGEVVAVAGTTRDVTDLKRAEDTLRESQEMVGLAMRGGRMGAWARYFNDNRVHWSADLEALFGLAPGTFGGTEKAFRDLVHPEDRPVLAEAVEKAVATRSDYRVEFRFMHASGEWRWMEGRGRAVYDDAGRPVRLHGIGIDINDRRQAEEALRRSEKRVSRIFETNLLGVISFDLSGGVQEANDEFLRIVGYSRDDLGRGRIDWSRMTPPQFKEQDERAVAELRETGSHTPIEKQYTRQDGSRAWVLVGAAMIDDWNGIAFVLDLSGLKTAEEALRVAGRRKDEFLATLAHELRNPLAPIRNAVHLLKRSQSPDAQLRTARDIIDRQLMHMVRLVDDLMDVSRITLGQVNLRHEAVSLGGALTDAIEAARPLIEAAEHSLIVHLPSENMQVAGDGTRLSQVFQNLLNNAAKYTPKGGKITLHVERAGDTAVASIRDSGIGIPEELQSRIFDLFTRVHPGEDMKTSGLGIGLALAKQLVELHGGDIEVRSEGRNAGSEFVVRLPLIQSAATSVEDLGRGAADAPATSRRVVVADDNQDAAESMAMLLRFAGCTVDVAFDGASAVELVNRVRPEIVLLDIGMPEMDGYEVARRIRSTPHGKKLVLVALTGWGQEEDRRRAGEAGFDEHLTKPVDPALLNTLLALETSP